MTGRPAGDNRQHRLSRPEIARRRCRCRRQREHRGRRPLRNPDPPDTTRPSRRQLGGQAYRHTGAQLRATAHRISDYVYEKLTGERGVFSTRIAYVVKSGRTLRAADRRRRRQQRPGRAGLARADHLAGLVTRRREAGLRFLRSQEAGGLRARLSPGPPPRRRQLQGLELGTGLVARWQAAGRGADQGRFLAALRGECRRQRRHALASSAGIDTEPRWSADGQ
jgi:TolB protein